MNTSALYLVRLALALTLVQRLAVAALEIDTNSTRRSTCSALRARGLVRLVGPDLQRTAPRRRRAALVYARTAKGRAAARLLWGQAGVDGDAAAVESKARELADARDDFDTKLGAVATALVSHPPIHHGPLSVLRTLAVRLGVEPAEIFDLADLLTSD